MMKIPEIYQILINNYYNIEKFNARIDEILFIYCDEMIFRYRWMVDNLFDILTKDWLNLINI